MSQYGARGRALAGQLAPEILAHYYQNTTLAALSPAAPVRILVLAPSSPTAAHPIVLHGRAAPFTLDGIAGAFPIGARAEIWRSGNGLGILVNSASGAVLLKTTSNVADLRFRAGADPFVRDFHLEDIHQLDLKGQLGIGGNRARLRTTGSIFGDPERAASRLPLRTSIILLCFVIYDDRGE